MRSLLKFILLALVIVFFGLWLMTVSKSCNKTDTGQLPDTETGVDNNITEVNDNNIDDLFEEDSGEDAFFNEEGDEMLDEGEEDTALEDDEAFIDETDDEFGNDEVEDTTALDDEESTGGSDDTTGDSSFGSSSGDLEYMVIGGAFLMEANAKKEANRLRNSGYNNAEVVTFDHSQYYSVCVNRFGNLRDARSLRDDLRADGNAQAYVHKKRKSKRK